jgi:hypothetical protein
MKHTHTISPDKRLRFLPKPQHKLEMFFPQLPAFALRQYPCRLHRTLDLPPIHRTRHQMFTFPVYEVVERCRATPAFGRNHGCKQPLFAFVQNQVLERRRVPLDVRDLHCVEFAY